MRTSPKQTQRMNAATGAEARANELYAADDNEGRLQRERLKYQR
jgi:hypothetical protein